MEKNVDQSQWADPSGDATGLIYINADEKWSFFTGAVHEPEEETTAVWKQHNIVINYVRENQVGSAVVWGGWLGGWVDKIRAVGGGLRRTCAPQAGRRRSGRGKGMKCPPFAAPALHELAQLPATAFTPKPPPLQKLPTLRKNNQ